MILEASGNGLGLEVSKFGLVRFGSLFCRTRNRTSSSVRLTLRTANRTRRSVRSVHVQFGRTPSIKGKSSATFMILSNREPNVDMSSLDLDSANGDLLFIYVIACEPNIY
jgi:hypothetical protein